MESEWSAHTQIWFSCWSKWTFMMHFCWFRPLDFAAWIVINRTRLPRHVLFVSRFNKLAINNCHWVILCTPAHFTIYSVTKSQQKQAQHFMKNICEAKSDEMYQICCDIQQTGLRFKKKIWDLRWLIFYNWSTHTLEVDGRNVLSGPKDLFPCSLKDCDKVRQEPSTNLLMTWVWRLK